jgi:hypothetical protein
MFKDNHRIILDKFISFFRVGNNRILNIYHLKSENDNNKW